MVLPFHCYCLFRGCSVPMMVVLFVPRSPAHRRFAQVVATMSASVYRDAIYCKLCNMWVNGPTQFQDHKGGKKHNRNLKKGHRQKEPEQAQVSKSDLDYANLDLHPEKQLELATIASAISSRGGGKQTSDTCNYKFRLDLLSFAPSISLCIASSRYGCFSPSSCLPGRLHRHFHLWQHEVQSIRCRLPAWKALVHSRLR